jgi:multidrug resistance efflux pump
MIDIHRFRSFFGRLARTALAVLLFPIRIARRFLLSARAWILFLLLLVAAIVTYYILSNRYTPLTTDAYIQAYVIQVAPRVEGQVVHVCVHENQAVKKGELLFEIDRRPFQHRVEVLEAKRVWTVQQVAQLESELSAAKAEDERLAAEEVYARVVNDQEKEIFKQEATTDRKFQDAAQKYKAAQAAVERSRAQVRKAEQALAARIGEEHALVAEVTAQLAEAKLNLEWTRVYAPANGYVTNVQLREGFYIHVGAPVLTCIDADHWWVVANFRENCLENIRPGQRVGLCLDTSPGHIYGGVVQTVGWGVDEGQSAPSGNLPAITEPKNWITLAQRFQVRITPELPQEYLLRVGAKASVAVYTREEYWLNGVTEVWQKIVTGFDNLH